MVKLSNNCGEAAKSELPRGGKRQRFPALSRPKTAARGPGAAVKGPARVVVRVWGPGKGRRAGFRRRKGSPGREEEGERLGAAAVAAVGLRRRETGESRRRRRLGPRETRSSPPFRGQKVCGPSPGGPRGRPRSAGARPRGGRRAGLGPGEAGGRGNLPPFSFGWSSAS